MPCEGVRAQAAWRKPAQITDLYPAAADYTGSLVGSRYVQNAALPAPLTGAVVTLTVPIGNRVYTGTGTPAPVSPVVGKFKITGANLQQRCTLYGKTGLITGSGKGLKGFNAVLLQKQGIIVGYGIDAASPATGEAIIEE